MSRWRQRIEERITSAWYEGAGWLWLLWPLSKLFQLLSFLRRRRFERTPPATLPVPVVVVGGITVGGTGKTPVIIELVRALSARGLRIGVVSRGYGGTVGNTPVLIDARATAALVGDEPLLVALSCEAPVAVCTERGKAVELLADKHPVDLVLSDDGLQHYAMHRDFEIVVLDAARGLGNGHLLPMGPLREGRWRLNHVDWVLERNGQQPESGFFYYLNSLRHWRSRRSRYPADVVADWASCKVAAVTALGQPEQFFESLEGLGLDIHRYAFPDHYALTKKDLDGIVADVVVITEKDAVKIESFDDDRIWVLSITAQLPAVLIDTLAERFGKDRERRSSCITL